MLNSFDKLFREKRKELSLLFNDYNRGYINEKDFFNTLKYYLVSTYSLDKTLPKKAINDITEELYYDYIDGKDKELAR